MHTRPNCYCDICKKSREDYRQRNKDRINARRRELRRQKKAERTTGNCPICEIKLAGHNFNTIKYCQDCIKHHRHLVNLHKSRESYRRKHNVSPSNFRVVEKWRREKSMVQ